ncbi:MAG: hypothetical protein GC131_02975, partial [Alphaproteobacteria bacterium]|nr:hypothetical protein [Alphaproteobacteria bacterium]
MRPGFKTLLLTLIAVLALGATLAQPAAQALAGDKDRHESNNHHGNDSIISRHFGNYPVQGDHRSCGRARPGKHSTVACRKGDNRRGEPIRFMYRGQNKCFIIENYSRNVYFVPLRTEREWDAFRRNCPRDVVIRECPKTPEGAIDGICGTANGEATEGMPTQNLCQSGHAGDMGTTGDGWAWSCFGDHGGADAGCWSIKNEVVDGGCGPVHEQTLTCAPGQTDGEELCDTGFGSEVAGNGPWTWTCESVNGGTTASCIAYKEEKTDGRCGDAAGKYVGSKPMAGLCAAGTASTVFGHGPWYWFCSGENGGHKAHCAAGKSTKLDGACGASAGMTLGNAPHDYLCDAGTASDVSGNGPWSWTCNGAYGGANASCSAIKAAPVNGMCGPSNGQTVQNKPAIGLCDTGEASNVLGNGPWSWSCAGENGGADAQCGANKTEPVNGACGPMNGQTLISAPSTGLCATGAASGVSGSGPWSWSCTGTNGGSNASCSASKAVAVNGTCGPSDGKLFTSKPTTGLCAVGAAGSVSGSGPWSWSCMGANGGGNASCSAKKDEGVVKLAAGGGGLIQWGAYQNTSVAGFNWDNAMHVCAAAGYEYIVAARGPNGRGDCSGCNWTLWSNPGHPPVAQLPNYKIPAANSGKWSVRGQGSWSSASGLANVWCSNSPGQRVAPDCKGGSQTATVQQLVTPEVCTRTCARCALTCKPAVYKNVAVTLNLPDGYWSDYSYGLPITTVHPNDNRAIHWGADDYGVAAVYYTKSSL